MAAIDLGTTKSRLMLFGSLVLAGALCDKGFVPAALMTVVAGLSNELTGGDLGDLIKNRGRARNILENEHLTRVVGLTIAACIDEAAADPCYAADSKKLEVVARYVKENWRKIPGGCKYTTSDTTSYANGRNGRVHYYHRLKDNTRQSKCPVARLNADVLHATVLHEIERAVCHHTRMHQIIAESGGWQGVPEDLRTLRGQLGRQKQFIELQIGNITRAIREGRSLRTLLNTLENLERQQESLAEKMAEADEQIALATIARPTAEQVQATRKTGRVFWGVLSSR